MIVSIKYMHSLMHLLAEDEISTDEKSIQVV